MPNPLLVKVNDGSLSRSIIHTLEITLPGGQKVTISAPHRLLADGTFTVESCGQTYNGHALFGDRDGNGAVDGNTDLDAFQATQGPTGVFDPQFDLNGTGEIEPDDAEAFYANLGQSI